MPKRGQRDTISVNVDAAKVRPITGLTGNGHSAGALEELGNKKLLEVPMLKSTTAVLLVNYKSIGIDHIKAAIVEAVGPSLRDKRMNERCMFVLLGAIIKIGATHSTIVVHRRFRRLHMIAEKSALCIKIRQIEHHVSWKLDKYEMTSILDPTCVSAGQPHDST